MTYDFSFDKKAVWALFAGSLVLGVLLFVAGLLVGGNLGEKASAAQADSGASKDANADAAVPAGRPAPAPGEPVLLREPLAPSVDAPVGTAPGALVPGMAPPNLSSQNLAAQGLGAQGGSAPRMPPASSAAPFAGGLPVEEAPRQSAPSAVRDPDPKLVQEAETEAPGAAEAEKPAPLKGLAFAVQVGGYQEEKGARRLAEELEHKGYTPSIFSGRDAENKLWFAVRIGAYATAKDASHAAANFTTQEK